jgi:hypothetical protein
MVRLITFLVANAISRPVLVVDPDPPDYMSDDEIKAMAEGFAKLLAGTKPGARRKRDNRDRLLSS